MGPVRTLASPASAALVAVLALVALLPDCAAACSCAALPGTPQERAEEALSGSTAVFSGEVVGFEKPPPDARKVGGMWLTVMGDAGRKATVTLRVSEVWKGPQQRTVTITTEADSGMGCGYPFEEGREYLVYASGEDPSVSLCGESKPLDEAGADLRALGDGGTPKGGGVLTDTSGVVGAPAAVGLAGAALAAAFLLAYRLLRTR